MAATQGSAGSRARDLCQAPWRLVDLLTAFCLAPLLDRGRDAPDPRQEWFFREAEKLKEDLGIVFSAQSRTEILAFISYLDAHREEYRASFLLWLEVVEELSLEVELDLGDNTGPVKLRRVKAGIFYLLDRFTEGADVPGIPRYLDRFVLQIVIRGTVEFIISLVNVDKFEERPLVSVRLGERGLWTRALQRPARAGPRGRSVPSRRVDVRVLKVWEPLWGRVVDCLVSWILGPPWMVSPRLKQHIDAIVARYQSGADGQPPLRSLATWFFDVIRWVGAHGREVRAAISALTVAIQLTAELGRLTREERIDLVEEALIRVFEDMGIGGAFFRVVLRLMLDVTLDAIVQLFEKRGVLSPPQPA